MVDEHFPKKKKLELQIMASSLHLIFYRELGTKEEKIELEV